MRDYYQILGVASDADRVAIRTAYDARKTEIKSSGWYGGISANADMLEINRAFEVLSHDALRSAYDEGRVSSVRSANARAHAMSYVTVVGASAVLSVVSWLVLIQFNLVPATGLTITNPPSRTSDPPKEQAASINRKDARTDKQAEKAPAEVAVRSAAAAATEPTTLSELGIGAHRSPPEVATVDPAPAPTPPVVGEQSIESLIKRASDPVSAAVGKPAPTPVPADPLAPGVQAHRMTTPDRPAFSAEPTPSRPNPGSSRPARQTNRRVAANDETAKRPRKAIRRSPKLTWRRLKRRWSPQFQARKLKVDLASGCRRCRWFRISAKRRDIHLLDVRIHYADGTSRTALPVPAVVRDEERMKPFQIGQRAAPFSHLSIVHQAKFNLNGGAWIEVWGLLNEETLAGSAAVQK